MDNLIVFSSTRKNINIDNMCHMETTVAPSCTRISTHLLRQCKLCMFWRHRHIKYERVCTDTMSSKDAIMKVLYIDVYLNTYWPHNDVDYQSDIYEKINNQRYIKNLQHYLLKSADILSIYFIFFLLIPNKIHSMKGLSRTVHLSWYRMEDKQITVMYRWYKPYNVNTKPITGEFWAQEAT